MVYESYLQSDFLKDQCVHLNPRQQLEFIMASSLVTDEANIKWAALFAKYHGLDFDAVCRKASFLRFIWSPFFYFQKKLRSINSFQINVQNCPIKNIFEASIVAGTVREISPNKIHNFIRLVSQSIKC